jgi:polysaccharide deacetylase family protein (PEP-CTERM system associated)
MCPVFQRIDSTKQSGRFIMTDNTKKGPPEGIDGTLTIDVEEWFCAHNLSPPLIRRDWELYERRAESSTRRLLDLLDAHEARATFFMLGWVMERSPGLAEEIHHRGHEVATHGYDHRSLTAMTPDEFSKDLDTALKVHAWQLPVDVLGYRAPSFTLTADTQWIIPVLESRGLRYSSSVFPMRGHPVYGMPDAPLEPWRIGTTLMEVPLTVALLSSLRIPCAGGAYLRLLPFSLTQILLRSVRKQGRLLNLYLHPWEIDPGQPRIVIPRGKRIRHYRNLHKTENRLRALLSEFRFTSIKELPCLP